MGDDIESGLASARRALIDAGFCGAGDHGTGDPEINAIDTTLAVIRTNRRLGKLSELGFTDAADYGDKVVRSHFDKEGCDPPQWHGPTGE